MKKTINDFHRTWIASTTRAMAERPSATRQDLIQQTLRLEKAANSAQENPATETINPCSSSTAPLKKANKAASKNDGRWLSAALSVVEPAHQGKEDDYSGLTGCEKREKWRSMRREEQRYLREWLEDEKNTHLRIDGEFFQREWETCGSLGGCEHDVWPTQDGKRFMKRTQGLLHANWREYLRRLEMSNQLFPAVPFRLEGFGNDTEGHFCTYVSQPAVYPVTRGVPQRVVSGFMFSLGFTRVRPWDFLNEELGLQVEDLHDQNVLYGPEGNLFVIDAIIYLLAKNEAEQTEKGVSKLEQSTCRRWDYELSPSAKAYSERCKRAIEENAPQTYEETIANSKRLAAMRTDNKKPRDSEKKV
jgi:hypothetical protein